ncbi:hypothetical protein [Terrabacter carboxydivorans]|uniref:MinD-like ATPase involved in chromosome partitioning or flagellar assembly n=1 Tax=Terrabacter carboxydivorans TaxID=619730 RepID=A0ABN3KPX3_9MICO
MALIVLTSASGSPGVTTSSVGLALTWPRPVLLVEADPTGGSSVLAGYLRGLTAPTASLIDLALAHRHGQLEQAIAGTAVRIEGSSASVLPGTRSHTQAPSLVPLWEPLSAALKGLERTGQDVIVDAGRLGLTGFPEPLLYVADLCLLTVRSDLVSLSGARSWAQALRAGFERVGGLASLGLLMVGEGDPYTAREVRKVLGIPVVASLAQDSVAAQVFGRGARTPRKFDTSPLVRSLSAARDAIDSRIAAHRDELAGGPAPVPMAARP